MSFQSARTTTAESSAASASPSGAGGSRLAGGSRAIGGVPERLQVAVTANAPGEVCVTLAGELDLATVPALDRALAELGQAKLDRLLIDLRSIEFMDSSGLAAIIKAQRIGQANGYPLALRSGGGQVQRLLALTGLDNDLLFEGLGQDPSDGSPAQPSP